MLIEGFVWMLVLSVNLFAISSIMAKYLINGSGGPINFLLYQLIFAFPVLIVVSYFEYWDENSINSILNLRILSLFFVISFFAFLGFICLLNGFNEGNVSVGGIILSARVLFSVPLAIIVLSETYSSFVYISIILALIGSIVVSWDRNLDLKALFSLKAAGIRWYFLTTFFWSLSNFSIRYLGDELPTFTIVVIRQIYMIGFTLIYYFFRRKELLVQRKNIDRNLFVKLVFYVVILVSAQGSFVFGLSKSLTIAEAIGVAEGTFTLLFTLLLAKFIDNSVLKESLDSKTVRIRMMGALIAILGTLGVIFYS